MKGETTQDNVEALQAALAAREQQYRQLMAEAAAREQQLMAEAAAREQQLMAEAAEAAAREQQLLAEAAAREQQLLAEAAAREQLLAEAAAREQQLLAEAAERQLLAIVVHPAHLLPNQLSSLVQRIDSCQFTLVDENYLKSYLSMLDTSTAYGSEAPASLPSGNENKTMAMSCFRRGHAEQPLRVLSWNIDEALASSLVCDTFFNRDEQRMKVFVDGHAARLASVRRLLCHATDLDRSGNEASLQIFFLALLKELILDLDTSIIATVANSPLSVPVLIRQKNAAPTIRQVNGKTDIFVTTASESLSTLDNLRCHFELKAPFEALYQKASKSEKDQLVIENEAIFHMTKGHAVCGGLSDLFCIAVSVCCADPDHGEMSAHFLARRIVEPKAFIKRLLLLLCGPEALLSLLPPRSEWEAVLLTSAQSGDVASEGEGAADDPNAMTAAATSTRLHNQGRSSRSTFARSSSQAGADKGSDAKKTAPVTLESSKVNDYIAYSHSRDKENRLEEASRTKKYVYLWECRRDGLAPLTVEELRRREHAPAAAAAKALTPSLVSEATSS